MAQYLASNYFTGDGQTTVWNVSFAGARPDQTGGTRAYLDLSSVKAEKIVVSDSGEQSRSPLALTMLSPTQAKITPAVPKGTRFCVYRDTALEFPLVDFVAFASISSDELDVAFRQTLYAAQETRDDVTYLSGLSNDTLEATQKAAADSQAALSRATQALSGVSSAVTAANAANSTAAAAQRAASSASTASQSALSRANTASAEARTANTAAQEARNTSTLALGTAETASSRSNQAMTAASAATTTANQAKQAANQAAASADTANSNASEALTAANKASTSASEAVEAVQPISGFNSRLTSLSDRVDALAGGDVSDFMLGSDNLRGLANYETARSNLNVLSSQQVDTAIGSAVENHTAQADPHGQYLRRAESGTAARLNQGTGASDLTNNSRVTSLANTRVLTHENAADPHPQYTTAPEVSNQISAALDSLPEPSVPAQTNLLHNPGFRISQRREDGSYTSSSESSGNLFVVDRWYGDWSSIRSTDPIKYQRSSAPHSSGGHYMAISGGINNSAVTRLSFSQALPNIRYYAGKTYTLSFYVRASGSASFGVRVEANYGEGSGASATTRLTTRLYNAETQWQEVKVAFDVPSMSGKQEGDWSRLVINFDKIRGDIYAGGYATAPRYEGTLYLAAPVLVEGRTAGVFKLPSLAEDWANCLLFYERLDASGSSAATLTREYNQDVANTRRVSGGLAFSRKWRNDGHSSRNDRITIVGHRSNGTETSRGTYNTTSTASTSVFDTEVVGGGYVDIEFLEIDKELPP